METIPRAVSPNNSEPRPNQYFFAKQVIGSKGGKTIFSNKVIAVYPKGLKVVHDRTTSQTQEELLTAPIMKFVDIREFQYQLESNIFRFFYRPIPSSDPLPLATDLTYEFELALVSALKTSIDESIARLVSKRLKKKSKSGSSQTTGTTTGAQKLESASQQS